MCDMGHKLLYKMKQNNENSNIRVALVSPGLGHVKRGIETWTEDLGEALTERGVDITLYKGAGKKEHFYEKVIPCLKRSSALNKWLIKHRPGFLWRVGLSTHYTLEETTFTWNLLPELLLKQYDIIHTQDPDVAYILQKVCRLGLLKSRVILAHGTEESFKFLDQLDYVQHLAPYHFEEAVKNCGKHKDWVMISNFVDTDVFRLREKREEVREELGIAQDDFVVICVAALKKTHKRVDYLIKETSNLIGNGYSNVKLVLIGVPTKETKELVELGQNLLGESLRILENVPHSEIPLYLSAGDLFVLCSLKEMLGIVFLEAMACGIPCVAHQYPVFEWVVDSCGSCIDMSIDGNLSREIEKYFSNGFYQEKRKNTQKHIAEKFEKDVIIKQYLSMYSKVLSA